MTHVVFVEASKTGAGRKAIEYAKSRGYFVTLMTRNSRLYSADFLEGVDVVLECNTNSSSELSLKANQLNQSNRIDGVTTTADLFVPQASLIANLLGLPSIEYQNAMGVRNKYGMRSALDRECPSLNPPFCLAEDVATALAFAKKVGFPLVAKPQDQNDSINVKKINNEEDLTLYFKNATSWTINSAGQSVAKEVLMEGYIDGPEFSIETCQSFGKEIQLMGVTKKEDFIGLHHGNFTEDGLSFPVRSSDAKVLFDAVAVALQRLGITCGVIHTECRLEHGQVKIVEVNPRLAGDMLGSHAIELALGASPIEMLVEIALGKDVQWKPTQDLGAAIIGIKTERNGRFVGVRNLEDILKMPGVHYITIWSPPGTFVGHAYSNADLLGRIVTQGNSPDDAIAFARAAASHCDVEVV